MKRKLNRYDQKLCDSLQTCVLFVTLFTNHRFLNSLREVGKRSQELSVVCLVQWNKKASMEIDLKALFAFLLGVLLVDTLL